MRPGRLFGHRESSGADHELNEEGLIMYRPSESQALVGCVRAGERGAADRFQQMLNPVVRRVVRRTLGGHEQDTALGRRILALASEVVGPTPPAEGERLEAVV